MSLEELSAEQAADLRDAKETREVVEHRELWRGRIIGLEEDLVRLSPGGDPVLRQYTEHPGAVAVVAMRGGDGREEVLLERQYRHPVGALLWEIPAGLLDIDGEPAHLAAARELEEEADLLAGRWDVLVDFFTSPGGTDESLRIFLARELAPAPAPFAREDEEADLVLAWVGLDDAVSFVLEGRIHNPSAVAGILAAHAARARKWEGLRPVEAHWLR